MIRQPIVTIMGHVDHGKTSLLDKIRGSAIAKGEAGGITQAIGASIIPLETIKSICGKLLDQLKLKLTIPGLLFIDTPGHAAFVNLRKRGGNLADIAILVIDITEGLKPQTKESIEILKTYKTPFIIAANKVDMVKGWKSQEKPILQSIDSQSPDANREFETKLYEIVGQVFEFGITADRFDRVSDYTKQVAIVPVSAKTAEGIPELLMVLTGLAQKYLEKQLDINPKSSGKGTILEVKEQQGLGAVLDVIIYDGTLKVNDSILIGTLNEPISTKVKALFEPKENVEMREKKAKFEKVEQVRAATGVRLVALDSTGAVAGMPIVQVQNNENELIEQMKSEVGEVLIESSGDGVIAKADSLGSLEALTSLLKEHGITIRKSSIGEISKKDIADVEAIRLTDPLHGVIIGFNIQKPTFETNGKIIVSDIIYDVIDKYVAWRESEKKSIELSALNALTKPCKIEMLKGYVFRQNNPAIIGVEIARGTLRSNTKLMTKQGKDIGPVKGIQLEQENVNEAKKGQRVAISLPDVTIGRQIQEGEILYSAVPEDEFRKFKEYKEHLKDDEKEALKEIAEIMREKNPLWGI